VPQEEGRGRGVPGNEKGWAAVWDGCESQLATTAQYFSQQGEKQMGNIEEKDVVNTLVEMAEIAHAAGREAGRLIACCGKDAVDFLEFPADHVLDPPGAPDETARLYLCAEHWDAGINPKTIATKEAL
jgi:hypothetical protein